MDILKENTPPIELYLPKEKYTVYHQYILQLIYCVIAAFVLQKSPCDEDKALEDYIQYWYSGFFAFLLVFIVKFDWNYLEVVHYLELKATLQPIRIEFIQATVAFLCISSLKLCRKLEKSVALAAETLKFKSS